MKELEKDGKDDSAQEDRVGGEVAKKRAYRKPSFEHERVFETMALACGKVSATQGQCRFNRKTS
jgi:hypothetical protein